ncbi:MAG: TonB-dependent receptor [Flavobacteriaceae bacterium]|nr:TonB-dependent receptor [Flavobacteriaceae bacterium]
MKKLTLTLLISVLSFFTFNAQTLSTIKGSVVDAQSQQPLPNVTVTVNETAISTFTDANGNFTLSNVPTGNQVVQVSLDRYETQSFPVTVEEGKEIDLGAILLFVDLSVVEEDSGLISLTEDDLNDDDSRAENTAGLLQSSKDVFENRAAFDFSQAFFRIRGYDSQNAMVLVNGLPMNKMFNGRPQWNNWGGLNDVTRNQELSSGLSASNLTFGEILGSTNISTRASLYRPGLRISGSYSNRTYAGRLMATYSSGLQNDKIAYTFSASRRWAEEGFIDGSLYDAYSLFAALEYKLNEAHSLNATAIYAPNKRGGVSAITEREFNAMGRTYNPYWGYQEGDIRNSRIRDIKEPIFILSHFYEGERTTLTTSVAYQFGSQGRSRLDYANAPNPAPNYYKYLPNLVNKPQIDWASLYNANQNTVNLPDAGKARYTLYEDRTDDDLFTISSVMNTVVDDNFTLDVGASFRNLSSDNFATPIDLLGADYYADVNTFTLINGQPLRYDAEGEINKGIDDRIKYNYLINSNQINAFTQFRFTYDKADFFIGGSYTNTSHQRDGKFLNESFPNSSLGKSEKLTFDDFAVKGGVTYKITGRHLLQLNGAYLTKAPTIRNSFVNSRENNFVVPDLESEKITSGEASYIIRTPKLKSRLTGYYTDFIGGTETNFYYTENDLTGITVDDGATGDFIQETLVDVDRRHVGFEFGLEYQITPTIKASAAAAYGEHYYSDNATLYVSNDQSLAPNLFGEAYIKNYRVANGPQQAYSIGIEYRDPHYWWVSATGNYLSNTYVDVSAISRTDSFFTNPDSPFGHPFDNIDDDLARQLLTQEEFDSYYLVNLAAGKSWRKKGTYISLFASVNNLFDETFRTGGYEQSRTANYQAMVDDNANGTANRDFGNKYWYGFGRTYFINLAVSF